MTERLPDGAGAPGSPVPARQSATTGYRPRSDGARANSDERHPLVQLRIQEVPADRDTAAYLRELQLLQKGPPPNLSPWDHAAFVAWFERSAIEAERQRLPREYALALASIGLTSNEQTRRLHRLGLPLDWTAPLSPGYYPYTLPADLFERVVALVEETIPLDNRKRRCWIGMLSRVLTAIFHSHRVDRGSMRTPGQLSMKWLRKHAKCSQEHVAKALRILEQGMLECTHHASHQTNVWACTASRTTDNWIIISPRGGGTFARLALHPAERDNAARKEDTGAEQERECTEPDTNRADRQGRGRTTEDTRKQTEGQSSDYRLFSRPGQQERHETWRRRHATATRWRSGRRAAAADDAVHPKRRVPAATDIIEEARRLIERKAPTVDVDTALVAATRRQLDDEGVAATDLRLRLCDELLQQGVTHQYSYTRTGRLSSSDLASPLTASRRPGKKGHVFWLAVTANAPLFFTDLKSADPILAAVLSGDQKFFADCTSGDIYAEGARSLGVCAPEESLDSKHPARKLLKTWTMARLYGSSCATLVDLAMQRGCDAEDADRLARTYALYLRRTYPVFFDWFRRCTALGCWLGKQGEVLLLPNGFRPEIDLRTDQRGKLVPAGYKAAAWMVQSLTAYVNARLVLRLEELGYDVVFQIHDCVVTRKLVAQAVADQVVGQIMQELVGLYQPEWGGVAVGTWTSTEEYRATESAVTG